MEIVAAIATMALQLALVLIGFIARERQASFKRRRIDAFTNATHRA